MRHQYRSHKSTKYVAKIMFFFLSQLFLCTRISSQKFLVLIWSTSEGWLAESNLEPQTFLSDKKFQIETFITMSFWNSFFSCNSWKLSPVSRDIQSVFIYCNINFENSLNTKFSFLLLDYTLKTIRSTQNANKKEKVC